MKEKIKAHIHRQPAEWSRISLRSLGLRGPRESQIYNRDLPVGPGAEGLSARRGRQGPVPRRPHDVTAGASRSRKWRSQPLAPYSRVITKIGSYDSSSRIAQFYSKILQTMDVYMSKEKIAFNQPLTQCCHPYLRWSWQRDRNARAYEWFRRVVGPDYTLRTSPKLGSHYFPGLTLISVKSLPYTAGLLTLSTLFPLRSKLSCVGLSTCVLAIDALTCPLITRVTL